MHGHKEVLGSHRERRVRWNVLCAGRSVKT